MRVITFSRTFPAYHPKRGEPTHFVEKIWYQLINQGDISLSKCCELSRNTGIGGYDMHNIRNVNLEPKLHTIRAGNRWKAGDMFSPRVWSGKPYASKQIEFAPPMEVKRVWVFRVKDGKAYLNRKRIYAQQLNQIAINDGLTLEDLRTWFRWPKDFSGQIISWDEKLNYA